MTPPAQCEKRPLDSGHLSIPETSSLHELSNSTLPPHIESTSDNDTSERPVREKLKKTSLASIPKSTITSAREDVEGPVDHIMSIQDSEDTPSPNITANGVENRGRPLRKRSLDNREATPSEKLTQTPDGHTRKRSRDIRAGEAIKPEALKHGPPEPSLQEENEDTEDNTFIVARDVEDTKASSEIDTPPSESEMADQDMQESMLSPRKKRSRDQFEAESQREQKIAATDETRARRRSSEDERNEPLSTKEESHDPKEEERQSEEVAIPTESSGQTMTESVPAKASFAALMIILYN